MKNTNIYYTYVVREGFENYFNIKITNHHIDELRNITKFDHDKKLEVVIIKTE